MSPSETDIKNNDEQKSPDISYHVPFPEIINNKINTEEFLMASRDVVRIVEKFGTLFAPVKYDMQGNINKLTATYNTDKPNHVTLQDMILIEARADETIIATDALMWLRRALHMLLLFFEEIVNDYKAGNATEDLYRFLKKAYQESLQRYHGWISQQLFGLLSRMVPTRTQLLKAIANGTENMEEAVLKNMEVYLIGLRSNVETLETFYYENNLEDTTVV